MCSTCAIWSNTNTNMRQITLRETWHKLSPSHATILKFTLCQKQIIHTSLVWQILMWSSLWIQCNTGEHFKCVLKFSGADWSAYHWIPSYLLNLLLYYLMQHLDLAYICDAFQSDTCRIHLLGLMIWWIPVNLFYKAAKLFAGIENYLT